MCTHMLICSTEFAPPTKVEQICIFIKHRLCDQNTPQVQIYTPGVYCAYKRGLSFPGYLFLKDKSWMGDFFPQKALSQLHPDILHMHQPYLQKREGHKRNYSVY